MLPRVTAQPMAYLLRREASGNALSLPQCLKQLAGDAWHHAIRLRWPMERPPTYLALCARLEQIREFLRQAAWFDVEDRNVAHSGARLNTVQRSRGFKPRRPDLQGE